GGQGILEGAFELPAVRVVEDVVHQGTGARPLDDNADVQADQLQRVAVADVDAGEGLARALAVPDLRELGFVPGLLPRDDLRLRPAVRGRLGLFLRLLPGGRWPGGGRRGAVVRLLHVFVLVLGPPNR